MIIDEAHRMKSTMSSTREVVTDMRITWLLLLTGACCTAATWLAAPLPRCLVHACVQGGPCTCCCCSGGVPCGVARETVERLWTLIKVSAPKCFPPAPQSAGSALQQCQKPGPTNLADAGTPVQNNMGELFGLLNLLDPRKYPSAADFLERFGGGPGQISTADQIHALRVSIPTCQKSQSSGDTESGWHSLS